MFTELQKSESFVFLVSGVYILLILFLSQLLVTLSNTFNISDKQTNKPELILSLDNPSKDNYESKNDGTQNDVAVDSDVNKNLFSEDEEVEKEKSIDNFEDTDAEETPARVVEESFNNSAKDSNDISSDSVISGNDSPSKRDPLVTRGSKNLRSPKKASKDTIGWKVEVEGKGYGVITNVVKRFGRSTLYTVSFENGNEEAIPLRFEDKKGEKYVNFTIVE